MVNTKSGFPLGRVSVLVAWLGVWSLMVREQCEQSIADNSSHVLLSGLIIL